MGQEIVNVVDVGSLLHLAQSDNLDLLLADGRKVVITREVLNEAIQDPDHPNSLKITDWFDGCP